MRAWSWPGVAAGATASAESLDALLMSPAISAIFRLRNLGWRFREDGLLVSVAGGGDTVAALNKAGAAESFSYISTAGGARRPLRVLCR